MEEIKKETSIDANFSGKFNQEVKFSLRLCFYCILMEGFLGKSSCHFHFQWIQIKGLFFEEEKMSPITFPVSLKGLSIQNRRTRNSKQCVPIKGTKIRGVKMKIYNQSPFWQKNDYPVTTLVNQILGKYGSNLHLLFTPLTFLS